MRASEMQTQRIEADLCVIGAGSGGLSVAAGAAQLGRNVVLIEKGEMGGDCLNTGCVPSKALLAAAKHAQTMRKTEPFGIAPVEPDVDFAKVMDHVHDVIAGIAPHDSQERFEGLGCTVIRAPAKFVGPRTVEAGGETIKARYIVLATGSHAFAPPIDGLADVPYLTNETIFEVDERPRRLLIIGGGPIGMEMAQAHRRLGSEVVVLEGGGVLPKDDPALVAVVRARLEAEGVELFENAKVVSAAAGADGGVSLEAETAGGRRTFEGSHVLVAAGRRPNVDGLDLEAAGIEYSERGVKVDRKLRTTNKRVFALGDVSGGRQFTHVAGYHASVVVSRALFKNIFTANNEHLAPWVTYTDPELAHVGLTEAEARAAHGDKVKVVEWKYEENDRAQAERATDGFIKVVVAKNGRILGASIVGAHAGELIGHWTSAIASKAKIGAFTGYIAPYPTFGEVSKRAAGAYYTPLLFSNASKNIVKLLSVFG